MFSVSWKFLDHVRFFTSEVTRNYDLSRQACCVEYIILEGDNLSSLFPNAHLSLGGLIELSAPRLFALLATLAVLPTVWLRDLSVLSYISGKKFSDL